ncbi:ABC transporter ATP-binding protein [Geodermatophilus nigrescens]|uniref:Amino acid/amide ABC transporter ATP-binding protein 2, HAAT family n=1 Tax=Geodermatophilus nigrescens TaxID=1070870 RepID=A0A1M5LQB2_9ACTN|nr:ABC transporter ATP-binding protein [Geodermatophilus nigrescens]SHG66799.1 amino acid/amide ABC transporter ATP-binding protein 2, HAAT family [Geodermatophilus nigrescens]
MPDTTAPDGGPLLVVDGLTAGYNGVPAIRDLSFTVGAGEVVSVLGPNGAGKTTSLLAIVGLVPPMAGSVTALGRPVNVRRPHELARRGVLLVPDDRGIFPGLTVRDHFRLAQRRQDPAREAAVLDRFPALKGLLGRRVGLCSGGEQQMLTIAKALLGRPRVLMIDEMSLGLAPKIVQEMLPSIRALAREEGIGVVLVEQHIELALSVSDRGVILNHGRVVLEGAARDLLAHRDQVEAAYFGADEFAGSDVPGGAADGGAGGSGATSAAVVAS